MCVGLLGCLYWITVEYIYWKRCRYGAISMCIGFTQILYHRTLELCIWKPMHTSHTFRIIFKYLLWRRRKDIISSILIGVKGEFSLYNKGSFSPHKISFKGQNREIQNVPYRSRAMGRRSKWIIPHVSGFFLPYFDAIEREALGFFPFFDWDSVNNRISPVSFPQML